MLATAEAADEHCIARKNRRTESIEDARIESDSEVLAGDAQRSESCDVMRKRRQDQIEGLQLLALRQLARDLADQQPAPRPQLPKHVHGERAEILRVHDVRTEFLRLREHDVTGPRPPGPTEASSTQATL